MKSIFLIFKRDIKSMVKHPGALLIIIGICLIPSLYAWLNIKASWNIYGNTGELPVAVVNNDLGASMNGQNINVGSEVVKQLKDNHEIGWKFVNEKQGTMGVVSGKYYALIEIPEDFSKDLASLISDNPVKPEIIYKVNTKANAVAGEITEVAANTLVGQITTNFVQVVNEKAFSYLNVFGDNMNKNKEELKQLKNSIINTNKNMNFILETLQWVNSNSINLNEYLKDIKSTLPYVNSGIENLQNNAGNIELLVKNTKNTLNTSFNNLNLNLNNSLKQSQNINELINVLYSEQSNKTKQEQEAIFSQIKSKIDSISSSLEAYENFLAKINEKINNKNISKVLKDLNNIKSSINKEKNDLKNLQNETNKVKEINKNLVETIKSDSKDTLNKINNTILQYNSYLKPELNSIADNLIKATNEASEIIGSTKNLTNEINDLLNVATQGTDLASTSSDNLIRTLNQFKGVLGELSNKLENINNNELTQIITILQANPEFMGDFIANPFNLKQEAIYPIPNYGAGMTPIYSVLALWVGALMLTSILSTDVVDFPGSENLSIRQKYFGKMITFIFLALIQGLIVSVGDKLILKVYTVNAPLMILFALACSFTFSIIVYTLVSLFGNIGKALAIVCLVIQIAGCGGTYPIQIDPKFFRVMQPFFPFTYGVGGFREAIAGPLFSSVALDFISLFLFIIVFLLLGALLKKPLDKIKKKYHAKFEEAGISEE
ncbi:YhgE/Pip domain-containing protein [Clostridium tarantellae]|uniref:YhgE/Pip domain-containing protein n=1 Tax=Clostridium tarantellae TaxID=39493 RepID=A0A6I1ML15_9CLOT|nr:YhgE/Pip domain-containing protein [Clostridium tarantellae]MPQ43433.1 YhgE/Pip domain-containing protein [Clostridium tarantellae]